MAEEREQFSGGEFRRDGVAEVKIGLVGFHCRTGLGELNRQIATYCDGVRWLVVPHRHYQTLPLPDVDAIHYRHDSREVAKFIRSVDVVLFCETPLVPNLVALCQKIERRVVCVPMLEWTASRLTWLKSVDLFVCPTKQSYEILSCDGLPCAYFSWPVDTERFTFKQRTTCRGYLYLEGHGGTGGRKGGDVVRAALKRWPEMPLSVRSQTRKSWPVGVKVLPEAESNESLYDDMDVLILPHHVDGIGLESLEAAASGMPVIVTDGEPWNEYPALSRIESKRSTMVIARRVPWFRLSPNSIVETCRRWLGQDVSVQSREARAWAEANRWGTKADEFRRLVCGESS